MNRNSILIFYKLSFLIKLIILKYYLFVLLLNNFLFHLFCIFFKIIIIQDNQYISVSKIDEVISASSLAYALPKDGPRLIEIITAQADQKFLQLMKESTIYTRFKTDNFIQKQKDIAKNKPIDIVIPIFCNIGNPLKRFQTTQVLRLKR